jgi:hypothetical protein
MIGTKFRFIPPITIKILFLFIFFFPFITIIGI